MLAGFSQFEVYFDWSNLQFQPIRAHFNSSKKVNTKKLYIQLHTTRVVEHIALTNFTIIGISL